MRRLLVTALLVAVAAVPVRLLRAEGQDGDRPLDPKVIKWDQGADKIDVSKYSAEMKQKYKVFSDLCARCHSLARAVNCDFVLEDDWERYIKRMMRRGRSLITPDDAEKAFEFAVYDSKIRKRELYERRLKETNRH